MEINESLRGKSNFNKFFSRIIVLFFIGALVGCSKNVSVQNDEITAKVAGRILDESAIQGVSVKLLRLNVSGENETVSLKTVFTNKEGKFVLETDLDGENYLMVQADKDGKEWRGILSADVKPGIAVYIQPLNNVTTISTDLFANSLKAGSNIEYTQIGLLLDKNIAEILDAERELMNKVVSAFDSETIAEKETLLRIEIGGTTSQLQQINVAKIAAQTALDRDLYYAMSESAQQAALYNYLCSISDAYVDVGMQSDTFSKVLEASIRTFLKEIEGSNSRLEFEFLRRTSEIRARVLNAAVLGEFQKLGADPSMMNKVIDAGDDLQVNLLKLQSAEEIADEFISYQNEVQENLIKALGIYGNIIPALQENIDDYKTTLIAEVENSADTNAIISAYINFYGKIKDLAEQQINSGTIERNAAAEVLIISNMYY